MPCQLGPPGAAGRLRRKRETARVQAADLSEKRKEERDGLVGPAARHNRGDEWLLQFSERVGVPIRVIDRPGAVLEQQATGRPGPVFRWRCQRWPGPSRRPGVAPVTMGRVEDSLPLFRKAFAVQPGWRELTPRLRRSGLLPGDLKLIERIVAPGNQEVLPRLVPVDGEAVKRPVRSVAYADPEAVRPEHVDVAKRRDAVRLQHTQLGRPAQHALRIVRGGPPAVFTQFDRKALDGIGPGEATRPRAEASPGGAPDGGDGLPPRRPQRPPTCFHQPRRSTSGY